MKKYFEGVCGVIAVVCALVLSTMAAPVSAGGCDSGLKDDLEDCITFGGDVAVDAAHTLSGSQTTNAVTASTGDQVGDADENLKMGSEELADQG